MLTATNLMVVWASEFFPFMHLMLRVENPKIPAVGCWNHYGNIWHFRKCVFEEWLNLKCCWVFYCLEGWRCWWALDFDKLRTCVVISQAATKRIKICHSKTSRGEYPEEIIINPKKGKKSINRTVGTKRKKIWTQYISI